MSRPPTASNHKLTTSLEQHLLKNNTLTASKMQYLVSLLPFLATAAFASPIIKRADNQLIQSTLSGRCLSPPSGAAGVADGAVGIETNVVTIDCDDAAAWNISPGSGSVILSGTDYALDAGENPGSTGGVKVSDAIQAVLTT